MCKKRHKIILAMFGSYKIVKIEIHGLRFFSKMTELFVHTITRALTKRISEFSKKNKLEGFFFRTAENHIIDYET